MNRDELAQLLYKAYAKINEMQRRVTTLEMALREIIQKHRGFFSCCDCGLVADAALTATRETSQ